jgi:multidrug efflux system membrane fusion protein
LAHKNSEGARLEIAESNSGNRQRQIDPRVNACNMASQESTWYWWRPMNKHINTPGPVSNDPLVEIGRTNEEAPTVPPLSPAAPHRRSKRSPANRKWQWRTLTVAVAFLLIAGVGLALQTWMDTGPEPMQGVGRPVQEPAVAVGAATIGTGNIEVTVNALGTVTPLATVTVQTQINGRVTKVGFTEGQTVKKGDSLVQIDPRTYEDLKAQYEGQLARDQALLAQAKTNLVRYKALVETHAISQQQYEDQMFLVQQYEGTVRLDQALIDQQALNIEYCHIVSPITGRIGLRSVDPGNYLQTSNNTAIAVITQLQPISVVFTIPEDKLLQVLAQMRSGKTLQVTVYDRANVTKLAIGTTTAIDSQIDTSTGTVKLRAIFDNKGELLFPNQFVNIKLLVEAHHRVLRVPISAIQSSGPGSYVYLIKHDNTVAIQPIIVSTIDGDMAQVEFGLDAGDQVVVDGADQLRDGAKVIISARHGDAVPVGSATVAR